MKCLICNKETSTLYAFSKHIHSIHNITPKEYYDQFFKKESEGICPVCKKETPFLTMRKGYQKHCCARCAQRNPNTENNFRKNNPQKNALIKNKTKTTMLSKYGGYGWSSNVLREKSTTTLVNNYGVSNIFQLPTIQTKARKNSHTKEANSKRVDTQLQKIEQLEQELNAVYIQNLLKQTKSSGWYQSNIVTPIKYQGHLFIKNEDVQTVLDYDNNAFHVYSLVEKRIVQEIKAHYSGEIIENSKKIIKPKELDIYIPEKQIAVEFNGVYFHSSLTNTSPDYHLAKSVLCRQKGIRLVHIYEFEDVDTQIKLLLELISGIDNYPQDDFNKNNLLLNIPKPEIIYNDGRLVVYGAGKLK